MDDTLLVEKVLAGDRQAFEELVRKHHPRIFRLVRGILGDWQRSEDVCQEVFVKAYFKLPQFEQRSRFSTWLYRVAVNAALKARRRHRSREVALECCGDGPVHDAAVGAEVESSELVAKLLRPLPSGLRAVVVLREQLGLSYSEIARVLGCSQGAVEQRLFRAYRTLREIWKNRREELGLEK